MRQHGAPVLLRSDMTEAVSLPMLPLQGGPEAISEADLQEIVQRFPSCLPIAEIDAIFVNPVPICRELVTPAGSIDNFMLTTSGLPVLIECKLWRNPEGRREVVGQILDYAKALSLWSSSDLQRQVSRRLNRSGNVLIDLVRESDPTVDEIAFHDALTANLRRGRYLLLIVGDGIREGVEAITEYLQKHASLDFSLGLVELPIYVLPDGSRLVAPRVLAKTQVITRVVVEVPPEHVVQALQDTDAEEAEIDPDRLQLGNEQRRFWGEFLDGLKLDDPEQPLPRPARQGYLVFNLPAPGGSSWLTVYRDLRAGEVGVFLSSNRNSPGEQAMQSIAQDWDIVRSELGGDASLSQKDGRPRIGDARVFGKLDQADSREHAFTWLRGRVNAFVSVMRPRVRAYVADHLHGTG